MRAATVVQVLQDFEEPPTIAPRPPTTVANPHIDRSSPWDQRKPTYSYIIDGSRPPAFEGKDCEATAASDNARKDPSGNAHDSNPTTNI